jgi:uncharacterized membrane protein
MCGHISNAKNNKMLQTTKSMHIIICLFIVEVTTISAVEKITTDSNAITMAATEKVIFNSNEMNHDSDTESQLFCSYLATQKSRLQCSQHGLLLLGREYCATFNEKTK